MTIRRTFFISAACIQLAAALADTACMTVNLAQDHFGLAALSAVGAIGTAVLATLTFGWASGRDA